MVYVHVYICLYCHTYIHCTKLLTWYGIYLCVYTCFPVQFAIALRDIADDLVHRTLRDVSDFEWQRFPRLQSHSELTVTEQHYLADQEEGEGRSEDGRRGGEGRGERLVVSKEKQEGVELWCTYVRTYVGRGRRGRVGVMGW